MPSASSRRRLPAWMVVALVVGAVVLWAFARNGSGEFFDPAVVSSQSAKTAAPSGTGGPPPRGGP